MEKNLSLNKVIHEILIYKYFSKLHMTSGRNRIQTNLKIKQEGKKRKNMSDMASLGIKICWRSSLHIPCTWLHSQPDPQSMTARWIYEKGEERTAPLTPAPHQLTLLYSEKVYWDGIPPLLKNHGSIFQFIRIAWSKKGINPQGRYEEGWKGRHSVLKNK